MNPPTRPPRPDAKGIATPWQPRAAVLTTAMAMLLFLPSLSPALLTDTDSPEGDDSDLSDPITSNAKMVGSPARNKPDPLAERSFDPGRMNLTTLALHVAGMDPDAPGASTIRDQLMRLDALPPHYHDVARATLEGMASALWHQQQALAALNETERAVLAEAHPGDPVTGPLAEALAKVDRSHLVAGLAALDQAAGTATDRIDLARRAASADGLVQQALRQSTGNGRPPPEVQRSAATEPGAFVDLAARVSGLDEMDLDARPALEGALADAPREALGAVGTILEALIPLRHGTVDGREPDLLQLAAAIDQAKRPLQVWAAMVLASQAYPQGQDLSPLPHPDAARPPLHWGRPRLTNGILPEEAPVPLKDAVRALATSLGDIHTAEDATALASPIVETLEPAQLDAVSRVLVAMEEHIAARQEAKRHPLPEAVDAGHILAWSMMLANGTLLEPDSNDADLLLSAVPALEAQREADRATEDLLTAVQELIHALAQPSSASSNDQACVSEEPLRIAFILAIDACGRPTTWERETMLIVDVGGDDAYHQRAGAPFIYNPSEDVPTPPGVSYPDLVAPINVLVDMKGNDSYITVSECAQGAACPDLVDPLQVIQGQDHHYSPVSILIDWDRDHANATNTFSAGARSQGYAEPRADLAGSSAASVGILVERVGRNASLHSSYQAGERAQGASGPGATGAQGALYRIVGSGSQASGSFQAADRSQASAFDGSAVFLNLAGDDAVSDDNYQAGARSQASTTGVPTILTSGVNPMGLTLFADVAGIGGQSHDSYSSGNRARGYTEGSHGRSIFLDAVLPPPTVPDEDSIDLSTGPGGLPVAVIEPALTAPSPASDDAYEGPIAPEGGYGQGAGGLWGVGGQFIDVGGNDDYDLHPDWNGANIQPTDRPRNDGAWADNGRDLDSHDDDRDLYPAFLEQLLGWDAHDGRYSPSPVPPRIILDLAGVDLRGINNSYALVLDLGGDDEFLSGSSVGIHLDLSGRDKYMGRVAAAGAYPAEGTGPIDPDDSDPPLAQYGLAFHLDLSGDDQYVTPLPRTQGYGEDGAIGFLADLGGEDLYQAPSHAQAVGAAGLGVLLDLTGEDRETNVFRAGPPSQGEGGLLVANGEHNTFDDGEGPLGHDGGGSFNLGSNDAPEATQDPNSMLVHLLLPDGTLVPVTGVLEVNETYVFGAEVRDLDGDDVQYCWIIEHGNESAPGDVSEREECGTSIGDGTDQWRPVSTTFRWNQTHRVLTSGSDDEVSYDITLTAQDSGGKQAEPLTRTFQVHNEPPRLLDPGMIVGPDTVVRHRESSYMLPFQPTEDLSEVVAEIDWGDGTPLQRFHGNSINWALNTWGSTTRLPEAAPVVAPQFGEPTKPINNQDLSHPLAIDGDNETIAAFAFDATSEPAIHVIVDFGQPRHIGEVRLNASVGVPFTFSLEGIDPDGRPIPLGTLFFDDKVVPGPVLLPHLPRLQGISLRQVADAGSPSGPFALREIEAWGPGASHLWPSAGNHTMTYTVVDAYGGRNASQLQVEVDPGVAFDDESEDDSPGALDGVPLTFMDFNGQGPTRHGAATWSPVLPTDLTVDGGAGGIGPDGLEDARRSWLTLQGDADVDPGANITIHWGDGETTQFPAPLPGTNVTAYHHWQQMGDHTVRLHYESPASARSTFADALAVHVEEGFFLHANKDPIMLLTLGHNGTNEDQTWHTGLQPHITVDASGDDRYFGPVGVPRRPLHAPEADVAGHQHRIAPVPSLLIDSSGDDDYLSSERRTQGFGHLASIALLLDVQGDDRYVAPDAAQGAADTQGVGALVDLDGDDMWNPIPASHPDIEAASPLRSDAWTTRPSSLSAPRPSLTPSTSDMVQGAAMEGIGLLLATGGHDTFSAGTRSQAWGAHAPEVAQALQYLVPEPSCIGGTQGATPPTADEADQEPQTIIAPTLINHPILCALGLKDVGVGLNSSPGTVIAPNIARDESGLAGFLGSEGPRFGPSLGALLHVNGSATYSADSDAQGAATESARAVLFDVDGGFIASSIERSQGYSRDGQAAFLAGGKHTASLQSRGRGHHENGTATPEGIDNGYPLSPAPSGRHPIALYVGPGADAPCAQSSCTDAAGEPSPIAHDPDSGNRVGVAWHLDHDPTLSPPGPLLDWNASSEVQDGVLSVHSGSEIRLEFDSIVQAMPDEPVQVVVLTQPFSESDGVQCSGTALSPPILVHRAVEAAGTHDATLSIREEAHDGPLYPAGCHRIRVLARQVAQATDAPVTEWSKIEGDAAILPPPRVFARPADGTLPLPRVVAAVGQTATVPLVTLEPMVATAAAGSNPFSAIDLDLKLTNETGIVAGWTLQLGAWQTFQGPAQSGVQRNADIVPTALPPGTYRLWVNTSWDGAAAHLEREIAEILIDGTPPAVDADALPHHWWKASRPVPIVGSIEDAASDVREMEIRLLRGVDGCQGPAAWDQISACRGPLLPAMFVVAADCLPAEAVEPAHVVRCVREALPTFPPHRLPTHPCWPSSCMVVEGSPFDAEGPTLLTPPIGLPSPVTETILASLQPIAGHPGQYEFQADLVTADGAPGGPYVVQARATDFGGSSTGWFDLLDVGIDKGAPALLDIRSSVGTSATNRTNAPEPLSFDVVLEDCATPAAQSSGCVEGSHADPTGIVVMVRNTNTGVLEPAHLNTSDASDALLTATFDWRGDTNATGPSPVPGRYEVIVQATDHAGNLLSHSPGRSFWVDRQAPTLPEAARSFRLPDGQTAVKPGDTIVVQVDAMDQGIGSTWIDGVSAWLGGNESEVVPLSLTSQDQYGGTVTVPAVDGTTGSTRVVVRAVDAAHNHVKITSGPVTYYPSPSPILEPSLRLRSDSLDIRWGTDRPVTIQEAFVVPPAGDPARDEDRLPATIASDGTSHHVSFRGLREDTAYRLFLTFRDDAGHVKDFSGTYDIVSTQVRRDTDLFLDPLAPTTFSGNLTVTGRVEKTVASQLTFHLGAMDTAPIAAPIDLSEGDAVNGFSLRLDSKSLVPESLTGAVETVLYAVMEDGASNWTRSLAIRFDNAPPAANPAVVDKAPVNGWYNGTITVDANATDDTLPIEPIARVDGGSPVVAPSVTLSEDGRHVVNFTLDDAAQPPNRIHVQREFLIDRTAPFLDATTDLAAGVTREETLSLHVAASDAVEGVAEVSGIDQYRLRVNERAWGPWQDAPPDAARLDDEEGQQWIDVEVRDGAHNMERRSIPILVDRTPPRILIMRWAGQTADGDPILHVAAVDEIGSGGRSAGVSALRVGFDGASGTKWGPWSPSNGTLSEAVQRLTAEGGVIRVGVQDAAGNEASSGPFTAPPPDAVPVDQQVAWTPIPSEALLRDPAMAPGEGGPGTRFVFMVVAGTWNGTLPESVWVDVAGRRIELTATGPVLADGAQTYAGHAFLPATRLGVMPSHSYHASYGGQTISTERIDGPTVYGIDQRADGEDPQASARTWIPGPDAAWMLLSVYLLVFLVRGRFLGRRRP